MKGPHGPAVEVHVPTGLTIFAATYLVFIAGVLAVTVVATCRRQGSLHRRSPASGGSDEGAVVS